MKEAARMRRGSHRREGDYKRYRFERILDPERAHSGLKMKRRAGRQDLRMNERKWQMYHQPSTDDELRRHCNFSGI